MFRRWAYTIVTRRAADWQRAAQRQDRESDLEEQREEYPEAAADTETDEKVRLVRAALHELSGDDRAILALHYFEGFGLWEMAEILGVPEGTVKSRLHHARLRLREQLERKIS
jgi:RNA polymerase sigma-70 factor (ECF subfamily)